MITYGIVSHNHDASLTVLDDNKILFASESERFSKVKNDPFLHADLIGYCIDNFGYPEKINYFENPVNIINIINSGFRHIKTKKTIEKYLSSYFPRKDIKDVLEFKDHHLCHAASGALTSGFEDAAVIVMDAFGQTSTVTVFHYTKGQFVEKFKLKYPDSIGLFYSTFTHRLGYMPNRDEYILMAMAAFGQPLYTDVIKEDFFDDFSLNLRLKINCHRTINFYGATWDEQTKFNIAASVQNIFTDYVLEVVKWARLNIESTNLVLAGGCFFNALTNTKIAQLGLYDHIWMHPIVGDGGSSMGAAALDAGPLEFTDASLGYELEEKTIDIDAIVKELLAGNAVGLAYGRSDFCPRGLTHRVILMDPRLDHAREVINKVKLRESFRPLALMVLDEDAPLLFETEPGVTYRYMQYIVKGRGQSFDCECVKHIDNTSRILTVENTPSLMRDLLVKWKEASGCLALVSSSLNIKNQPVLNDENDIKQFIEQTGLPVFY